MFVYYHVICYNVYEEQKTYKLLEELNMYETYRNLRKLADGFEGDQNDLIAATELYKQVQCPITFSFIAIKLWGNAVGTVSKFWGLTDEEKASFVTEELHKSLMDYDHEKGASVQTFFCRYLARRMYAETKLLTLDKRKANFMLDEQVVEDGEDRKVEKISLQAADDRNLEITDVEQTLKASKDLSERELTYCILIARSSGEPLKDSDAAHIMGISPSAIYQMKQRLVDKLAPLLLAY
jgi:hypothetical protein